MRRPFGDAMDGTYLRLRLHDICFWISSVPYPLRPRCPRSLLRTSLLFCGACADCPRVKLDDFHHLGERPLSKPAMDIATSPAYHPDAEWAPVIWHCWVVPSGRVPSLVEDQIIWCIALRDGQLQINLEAWSALLSSHTESAGWPSWGLNPRRDSPYVMAFPIGTTNLTFESRIDVAMTIHHGPGYKYYSWVGCMTREDLSTTSGKDTYSASAVDSAVQSYFFEDQLTSLSPKN
ncbi:hypothetical protein Tco_1102286 [Tanacetum coccineum]